MARIETTILTRGEAACALGRIVIGARIEDGLGVTVGTPFLLYPSYALVLVTRGRGTYRNANGASEPLRPGSLILILQDLAHTYAPDPGTTWDEIYLVFDGLVFDAWRRAEAFPRLPVIHLDDPKPAAAEIESLAVSDAPALERLCAIQAFLARVILQAEPEEKSEGPLWLRRSRTLLTRDLARPLPLTEVAARVGMPYDTFRRRFAAAIGEPPATFRERARVREAANLLHFTDLTHAAIAARVGYTDEAYLARRFRAATDLPPRVFRARSRGQ